MGAVYKRELKSYFTGMIGYIFIAFLLIVTGIFAAATNFRGRYPAFEVVLSNVNLIMLLIVPILTMRVMAEEKSAKTDQLMFSLPVSMSQIVISKYLAMCTVYLIPICVMALYPIVLSFFGTVYFLSAFSGLLGYYLLGCALISIGMFLSSLTESQVIAAVMSFGVLLALFLMRGLTSMMPQTAQASYIGFAALLLAFSLVVYLMTKNYWIAFTVAAVSEIILAIVYQFNRIWFGGAFQSLMTWLSLFDRVDSFIYGLFDLTAVVYYLSVIVIFIFLSVQSIEKRRWS
ncbi:MAG: ABC transporter permease [Oscillospiraceae bacterium]|nr:ABC transporter permease [Oscillospiraceae bacterium]